VIKPGLDQLGAALLVLIATIGITFSLQARFADRRAPDVALRLVLAAFGLLALLDPDTAVASLACLPVLLGIGYWLAFRRNLSAAGNPQAAGTPALEL